MAAESPKQPALHLTLPQTGCHIRPLSHANPTEAPSMSHHANNPRIAKWMRNAFPSPYTLESAESWIAFTEAQSPKLDFAICKTIDASSDDDNNGSTTVTSVVIGAIGLKTREDVYRRTMEVGYWIGEEYWGRGIAREAVEVFARWVFGNEEFKHVGRLEAEVFEGNKGSCKVLERVGFVFEGKRRGAVEKDGAVFDVLIYGLLKEDILSGK
ncbi:acyl-CoA N-acyltransferase [Aspergillus pseudoustus]|uniref:Acyl-CoA N-acyltransferase n=1 Tax=Aspergillus pseudoustus TaxID=1810923 RepID=A0ABR4JVX4_9EURO